MCSAPCWLSTRGTRTFCVSLHLQFLHLNKHEFRLKRSHANEGPRKRRRLLLAGLAFWRNFGSNCKLCCHYRYILKTSSSPTWISTGRWAPTRRLQLWVLWTCLFRGCGSWRPKMSRWTRLNWMTSCRRRGPDWPQITRRWSCWMGRRRRNLLEPVNVPRADENFRSCQGTLIQKDTI